MSELQLFAAYGLIAIPTAWFGYFEIRRVWHVEKLTVLNFVPIVFASLALGARWPITAVERISKYLARLDQ